MARIPWAPPAALMPEYRAYLIGDDGHFIGCEHLLCADDSEALEKARRLLDQWPVELWSGDRFVARLGKPQDSLTNEVHEGQMVPKPAKEP